jgi:hypothetical protein
MSNAGGKKIKIWDGIVEYDEPVPDTRAEAVKAAIETSLTAFEKHKEALLAMLRNVYERGPKSEPFDADKTWHDLTLSARIYFWRGTVKQETMPTADCINRLRQIARALGRARRLADKQDDVRGALFSAWYDDNVRYDTVPTEPLVLVRFENEFDKVIAGLFAMETLAHRAVDDLRKKGGRPKGTAVLQKDDIEGLAGVYRDSTNSIPGAGDGLFAKFVMKFQRALGCPSNLKYESVIDAIKDAGIATLMRPTASK